MTSGPTSTQYDAGAAEPLPSTLARGQSIGRYLLLERVGAGGMGVVWSAYDPELDRRVALKLLRPRSGAASGEQARLVREAQAMAKLAHPHVIAVHDVGQHEGQVFLAMEFVEGHTLASWLARTPRPSWREIVGIFVQAGRGLAAAHQAGLAHRDFKPDNVLIGGDGRARVTDFGLARTVEGETLEVEADASLGSGSGDAHEPASASGRTSSTITRTGALLGTPAYMAPEQFGGGRFDARSDQFSFCVALWEALFGERPFVGRTLAQLSEAVTSGRITGPASEARVPGFLERALRRGLAVEPSDRWPDMATLLQALEREGAGRPRLARGVAALACVSALAIGPWIVDPPSEPEPPRLCSDAHERLAGVWDPKVRASLEAVVAEQAPGSATWRPIAASLDAYAQAWQAMYVDACEATHLRGEQSLDLLDRRMQCLDERREGLAAAVALLGEGEARTIEGGLKLIAGLPSVDACANRAYLVSRVPIPADPALAERVIALRAEAASAKARVDVGDVVEPIAILERLLDEAEALAYPPLRAELLTELAFAQSMRSPAPEVRDRLELAVVESIRTGQDAFAARAGVELIYVVGARLGDLEGGLRWSALVDAWHDRSDADDHARALAAVSKGYALEVAGRDAEAEATLQAALGRLGLDETLDELDALEPRARLVSTFALGGLAQLAFKASDHPRARRLLTTQREALHGLFPREHEQVVHTEVNLATAMVVLGEWSAATTLLTEIVDRPNTLVFDDTLETPSTRALALLADLQLQHAELLDEGPARARAIARASVRVEQLGEHEASLHEGSRVRARVCVARLARLRGDLGAAESIVQAAQRELAELPIVVRLPLELEQVRVVSAREGDAEALTLLDALDRTYAELDLLEHPMRAVALGYRGRALLGLGRRDEARVVVDEALGLLDALAPEGHPLAPTWLDLAAELALEPDHALALRERATSIRRATLDFD